MKSSMKKTVLLFLLLFCSVMGWASKGLPYPIEVRQTDGTKLTLRINGDADCNWLSTLDGVVLVQTGKSYFVARIDADGRAVATQQLAHNAELRGAEEQALCQQQNREAFLQAKQMEAEKAQTRGIPAGNGFRFFPHTGSPKAVVILVEFSDRSFKVPARQAFDQYLNAMTAQQDLGSWEQKNIGSVRKYFSDMSGGTFTPQFDLYGPVTLPHTVAYYGGGSSSSERYRELVADACSLADAQIDFSQYDADGDGNVDLVYIVYAGYGEQTAGDQSLLWAKAFVMDGSVQKDGKHIRLAGISNELNASPGQSIPSTTGVAINGVGLFCHEFSHCMGLPDFYPTVYWTKGSERDLDAYDNQGMEDWSVMDNGLYLGNGYTPTAYTAWEREQMGWLTIETLSSAQQVKLENIDRGGKAYRIMSTAGANEYYIVQAIESQGWNEALPGGMMVCHVNYDEAPFSVFSIGTNSVNNVKKKPRMTIVPADGLLVSSYRRKSGTPPAPYLSSKAYNAQRRGDLFPGSKQVIELTDASALVNYAPWNGGLLNKPIYNINLKSNAVYFDFLQKFPSTDIPSNPADASADHGDGRIYSLDGRYVGTDINQLPKGVFIRNHQKFVVR